MVTNQGDSARQADEQRYRQLFEHMPICIFVADLTVTAPSREASAKPAEVREPTGEIHPLDRSKPAGQVAGAIVVAVVSGGLGLWLVRQRG